MRRRLFHRQVFIHESGDLDGSLGDRILYRLLLYVEDQESDGPKSSEMRRKGEPHMICYRVQSRPIRRYLGELCQNGLHRLLSVTSFHHGLSTCNCHESHVS
jgi:hypothetical protein